MILQLKPNDLQHTCVSTDVKIVNLLQLKDEPYTHSSNA